MNTHNRHSMLFVCLGNIVRSPMAQISTPFACSPHMSAHSPSPVMNALLHERNIHHLWTIDSAGTSKYHIGEGPDRRTIATCEKLLGHKYLPVNHKARQLTQQDFHTFQYILYMDYENEEFINSFRPTQHSARVFRLGYFDPEKKTHEGAIVRDPYYDINNSGFEFNFHLIHKCLNHFLDSLE